MTNKDLGIRTVTESVRIVDSDVLLVCNTTSDINVYLPAADGTSKIYYIKNINTGIVTIVPDCSDTIDGDTREYLYQWGSISIVDYSKTKWIKP